MGLFRPQLQSLALNSFGYLHETKLQASHFLLAPRDHCDFWLSGDVTNCVTSQYSSHTRLVTPRVQVLDVSFVQSFGNPAGLSKSSLCIEKSISKIKLMSQSWPNHVFGNLNHWISKMVNGHFNVQIRRNTSQSSGNREGVPIKPICIEKSTSKVNRMSRSWHGRVFGNLNFLNLETVSGHINVRNRKIISQLSGN